MLSKKIISFGKAIEPKEKRIVAFGDNFLVIEMSRSL